MQPFLQWFFRGIARLVFRIILKLEVEGWENLPSDGPLLVIGNHFSLFEGPMLLALLPYGDRQTWMAATELQQQPILRAFFKLYNVIPVWRGQPDRTAIHRALDWLAAGKVVGIMPEGGVDETLRPLTMAGVQTGLHQGPNARASAELITPRPGAAYLAVRSGAPVLPTAFLGTEKVLDNLRRFRRTPVRMIIGPTFGPLTIDPALPKTERRAQLDEYGHEMMRHMAALMPPENRGPYR